VKARQRIAIVLFSGGTVPGGLVCAIEAAGYNVKLFAGEAEDLAGIRQLRPALIIACGQPSAGRYRTLSVASNAPILALLPTATERDILAAFAAGADDCQPATIGSAEVLLRIRTLARRGTD
jgi:DNA-binding response OmpR family regulator